MFIIYNTHVKFEAVYIITIHCAYIYIFRDLETSKTVYSVKGHDEIVNCIDGIGGSCPGAPELATGSRDGS
jgi:hypothetical protein